jgi:hypothetical protein
MKAYGLAAALLIATARLPAAQETWLDAPLAGWNQAGQAVPPAPPGNVALADPRCLQFNRPPQTAEDQAVAAAGWTLYAPYTGGWGAVVVAGLADYDGMCRPVGYQYFAFVDGAFAGTLSPVPMAARTDGAAQDVRLDAAGALTATFARYAPADPLCCPSLPAVLVRYRVAHTPNGPVLLPEAATPLVSP